MMNLLAWCSEVESIGGRVEKGGRHECLFVRWVSNLFLCMVEISISVFCVLCGMTFCVWYDILRKFFMYIGNEWVSV